MKVVILSSGLGPGTRGIGQYENFLLPPLLDRLAAAGAQIDVVLAKEGVLSAPPAGVQIVRLPVRRNRTFLLLLAEQFQLPRLTWGADVFLSLESVFPLTPLRVKKKMVVVHDIHVIRHVLDPDRYPEDYSVQYKFWAPRATRKALKSASWIITDAEFTRGEIHDVCGIPLEKIRAVPCGLDSRRFHPRATEFEGEALGRRYGLPPSFYLFVGPYSRKKNLRLIVEAYASLPGDADILLPVVVVGDTRHSRLFEETISLIRRTGRDRFFHFLGVVPDEDLPPLYRAAEVFLYPSLYEGFGLPVLEAMACGTPVVASDRSTIPEVAGEAARLIDPWDPSALAAALRALRDPSVRSGLIERGRIRARSFTWEKTAAAIADLALECPFG